MFSTKLAQQMASSPNNLLTVTDSVDMHWLPKRLAYTAYGSDALASQYLPMPLGEEDAKNTASPNGIGGRGKPEGSLP